MLPKIVVARIVIDELVRSQEHRGVIFIVDPHGSYRATMTLLIEYPDPIVGRIGINESPHMSVPIENDRFMKTSRKRKTYQNQEQYLGNQEVFWCQK